MYKQPRRKRASFWRGLGAYLQNELIIAGRIAILCLLCIFICVSLLVGIYHVVVYLVLKIIFGSPASL
jgi:hypothetical protein